MLLVERPRPVEDRRTNRPPFSVIDVEAAGRD